MLDNLKFLVTDQNMINRLTEVQGFIYYKSDDKYYRDFFHSLKHKDFGVKLSLHFRKIVDNGNLLGYSCLHIIISPHYHFNNYLHNGNDLTPQNCIKSITNIFTSLGIELQEFDLIKVVNIEFGINIIPETPIENLINGLLFYSKTTFVVPNPKFPYSKVTDATRYKNIKAYAKGLQFIDFPEYGINPNTFRFEVKSKRSANIKKYGINTANDLLNDDVYNTLSQCIINEWEQVLVTNLKPDFSTLTPFENKYIKDANKMEFWESLRADLTRKKFGRAKAKYYKILKGKNNLHTEIKAQIIDKLISLQNVPYFASETPINIEKRCFDDVPPILIKGEYGTNENNIRFCIVTKLDISIQKKGSKYLCFAGLKWYKENAPETYKEIERKYLTPKMMNRSLDEQIYYIAHNIRNTNTNRINNRKRFEKRNYPPDQLQLFAV